jgi:outer membrane biosynthesis protein TonB
MEQPRYPGEALAGELEARVEAIFVIGSDGRVIPETIRFTRIDRAMFVAPVRSVLLDAEFRPGISGGCAVPTTAQQPFQFLIAP